MEQAREGALYKTLTVGNRLFPIYYGYYSEEERSYWGPTPLFPDFEAVPQYTDTGQPYVRADQDVCEHYTPKSSVSGENWCNDCRHFQAGEEIIGVCRCEGRSVIVRQNE